MFAFHSGQSTPNVRQGERLVLWEWALVFGSRICARFRSSGINGCLG